MDFQKYLGLVLTWAIKSLTELAECTEKSKKLRDLCEIHFCASRLRLFVYPDELPRRKQRGIRQIFKALLKIVTLHKEDNF